jgi:hypothetical protein
MITTSDLTVYTSCIFQDHAPIWMLETSAKKFGIPVKTYGEGGTYRGWVDIKIVRMLQAAKQCETSHLLYTDGRDAFFVGALDEIVHKYNRMGCPKLMLSAEPGSFFSYQPWYDALEWDTSLSFPYTGVGGQIHETQSLIDAYTWMLENYHVGNGPDDNGPEALSNDDVPFWLTYMKKFPGSVKIDHDCAIFMNAGSTIDAGGMWDVALEIQGERAYNRLTHEYPCIIHFNGGSSHETRGKWEMMEPYWKKFGFTERPPWEQNT